MRRRLSPLISIALLLGSAEASTRETVFRNISIEQGLSDSHVRSVVQDRQGFLWIGTADGLNRYDGYEMRIFTNRPGDPRSLGANFVYVLYVDGSGRLWAGTVGGGLHRFDPATEDFVRYQHDPNDPESLADNRVYAIYEDRDGDLWVGTAKGLELMERSSGRFRHYRHDPARPASLSHDEVYSVIEDRSGAIWVATYGGGLDKLLDPGAGGRFLHHRLDPREPGGLPSDLVRVVYEDGSGRLWVGTWGEGLSRLDPGRGSFERYNRGLGSLRIVSMLEDREGHLWVGTSGGGLSRFDPATESFETYRHDPSDSESLSNENIVSIYQDREGLLWIGSGGGGVNLLDPARKPFDTLGLSASHRSFPDVRDVHEDEQGTLWIGTLGAGLFEVGGIEERMRNYRTDVSDPNSLTSDVVNTIASGTEGSLWIGTSGGLNSFDRRSGRFRRYVHDPMDPTSLGDPEVVSILDDVDAGVVWVGTSKGLNRLDPRSGSFIRYADAPKGLMDAADVRAIQKDPRGILWLASSVGLGKLDPVTGESKFYNLSEDPGSSEIGVWALHEGEDGRLWLGSAAGLLSFDPETESVTRYADPPESRFGITGSILEDGEGRLWLGRSRGLSRFDPRTEELKYYSSDELHLRHGFLMGAFKSRSGRLFFGAGDGLLAFEPSEITDSTYAPPVVLTEFEIGHRAVPIREDSVLKRSITVTDSLSLPSPDSVISFEFAALSYRAPERNRYRYQLEGFDAGWTEVNSSQRRVTYTNLSPGEYVFRVTGSNNDRFWNDEGVSVTLEVLPFWWQTWWFRAGALAAAGILLFTAHRLRLRGLEKRAAELQREIEARHAAELALREREERNRSVLESLKSRIALLDREGTITAANEHWVHFAGSPGHGRNGQVGANFLETLRGEAGTNVRKVEEALSGVQSVLEGRNEHFELEYASDSSSGTLWHVMTVVPFRGLAGGAVVSYTDITDRRRAEEEAQKRREELAHVARVATMGELAASIAHEVNQPLASIVNYTNAGRRFLERGESSAEDVRGVLRAIAEQGKRAGEIIRHLREMIRKGHVERVSLDVNEELEAVFTLVHGDAVTRGVLIRRSLATDLPRISGNAVELHQVILNLVINSFEAMSQRDGGRRELTVRTWNEGPGSVEIALSDTGPPVSDEVFQKMFQRFYTSKAAGLGIGLSISQSIVEAHGGRLWAERNPERGLTMRLSLPAEVEPRVAASGEARL